MKKFPILSKIKSLNDSLTGTWVDFTTPASSGITLYNDSTATSGYIVRGGYCFVNLSIALSANVGDTSKAVVSGLPTSLKNTIKPPSWSSFAMNNIHAESLFQGGTIYIRNASASGATVRWNLSFMYPVAE